MDKNTSLIIGGSGGIGGAFLQHRLEQGWDIVAPLRNFSKPESQAIIALPKVTAVVCNVQDAAAVDALVGQMKREGTMFSEVVLAAGTFLWDDGYPGPQVTAEEVENILIQANIDTKESVLAALKKHYSKEELLHLEVHIISSHAANFPPDHPFRNGPYKEEKYVSVMGRVSGIGHQLRHEGAFKKVHIYEPGLVDTDMARTAFIPERAGSIDWGTVPTPAEYVKSIL